MSPTLFTLPSVLTHDQAPGLAAQLRLAAHASAALVVDASALSQFDSSALAVLLEGARAAHSQGGSWRIQGLPARACNLAQVYGLSQLLQLQPQAA